MNKQRNDLVSKTMHQFQAQHWAKSGVQDDTKEGAEVRVL